MRIWANKLRDNPPQEYKEMTKKDKIITTVALVVDATIICLLILALLQHSCEICFLTGQGYRSCKPTVCAIEEGIQPEISDMYRKVFWGEDNETTISGSNVGIDIDISDLNNVPLETIG